MSPKKQKIANKQSGGRIIATNRKARHQYHVHETLEAGLVLRGSEVKSIRAGGASIAEAFCRIADGEMWIIGMHVGEYFDATYNNHEPTRRRKLLLSRREIRKWSRRVKLAGATIVPLDLHFNERGYAKVRIALVTGKKAHDKRAAIKKRELEREARSYKR